MKFLYARRTPETELLAKGSGSILVPRFDGDSFYGRVGEASPTRFQVSSEDKIVCWGFHIPTWYNDDIVKCGEIQGKLGMFQNLANGMIKIGKYSGPKEAPGLVIRANKWGTHDFLQKPQKKDWSFSQERLDLKDEFRIHACVWGNKRLVGKKVPRVVEGSNPLVRSWTAGWGVDWTVKQHVPLGLDVKRTLKALNLMYGVIDVGLDASENCYVLKVNPHPRFDVDSLPYWTEMLKKWYGCEEEKVEPEVKPFIQPGDMIEIPQAAKVNEAFEWARNILPKPGGARARRQEIRKNNQGMVQLIREAREKQALERLVGFGDALMKGGVE